MKMKKLLCTFIAAAMLAASAACSSSAQSSSPASGTESGNNSAAVKDDSSAAEESAEEKEEASDSGSEASGEKEIRNSALPDVKEAVSSALPDIKGAVSSALSNKRETASSVPASDSGRKEESGIVSAGEAEAGKVGDPVSHSESSFIIEPSVKTEETSVPAAAEKTPGVSEEKKSEKSEVSEKIITKPLPAEISLSLKLGSYNVVCGEALRVNTMISGGSDNIKVDYYCRRTGTDEWHYTGSGKSIDFIRQQPATYQLYALAEDGSRKAKSKIVTFTVNKQAPEWVLPSCVRLPSGNDMTIFFQNICRYYDTSLGAGVTSDSTEFICTKDHGINQHECSEPESYSLGFTLRDPAGRKVMTTKTPLKAEIIPEPVKKTKQKKVLFIGDSMTAANKYPDYIRRKLDENEAMDIVMLGTKNTNAGAHEGHNGWRAYTYAECPSNVEDWATFGKEPETVEYNPFWNGRFDFRYYMESQGYDGVDYVFINLGTNDIIWESHSSDEEIISYYSEMIGSIHSYDKNIKICIWLPPTRGVAENAPCSAIDTALRIHKILISNFDNREEEGIWLCPVYMAVNPCTDYKSYDASISDEYGARELHYCRDALHPSDKGYERCAEMLYTMLCYFVSQDAADSPDNN